MTSDGTDRLSTTLSPTQGYFVLGAPLLYGIVHVLCIAGAFEISHARDGAGSVANGNESAAKEILARFLKPDADPEALSNELRPTLEDCQAVFSTRFFAAAAHAHYEERFPLIRSTPGKTEVRIWRAKSDDLKKWNDKANQFGPTYQEIAAKLNDGITIYGFCFGGPDRRTQRSVDGLIYVNGHWRLFYRPSDILVHASREFGVKSPAGQPGPTKAGSSSAVPTQEQRSQAPNDPFAAPRQQSKSNDPDVRRPMKKAIPWLATLSKQLDRADRVR
jgi:hypothetical protein